MLPTRWPTHAPFIALELSGPVNWPFQPAGFVLHPVKDSSGQLLLIFYPTIIVNLMADVAFPTASWCMTSHVSPPAIFAATGPQLTVQGFHLSSTHPSRETDTCRISSVSRQSSATSCDRILNRCILGSFVSSVYPCPIRYTMRQHMSSPTSTNIRGIEENNRWPREIQESAMGVQTPLTLGVHRYILSVNRWLGVVFCFLAEQRTALIDPAVSFCRWWQNTATLDKTARQRQYLAWAESRGHPTVTAFQCRGMGRPRLG